VTGPDWWDEARRVARYVAWDQKSAFLDRDEAEAISLAAVAYWAAEWNRELTRKEMRQVSFRAVSAEANKVKSMRGISVSTGEPTPRFAAYWVGNPRLASPFEERIIERVALWQVWWSLDELTQEILIAYTGAETSSARARLAGYAPASWATVLGRARERARRKWYDHERDPGQYPYGRKRRWAA
jgi:hypothetical protein